ncbi:FitA-like ribbon-helix-helix domain-containing protein [Candidatus Poriferisodalis sp.]|uniref:FitA-like ribbon-helix-helix domain-containing protein n=1 Tax=Candidatus Poriferisodalis sp. TaxID=3101277 RepID=UPI003B51F28D
MATIQIKHVPDEVHDKLKRRAATTGQSLQQYMLDAVCREAEMASIEELLARKRVDALVYGENELDMDMVVEIIRADRESH